MPYYRTRYECYEEDEDLVNVVPAKVTGEHTRRTKVLCHIFDQQEEGLVKKWMECAYEKPTSQLMHVYGSVNRSKESDILVFTERDHESLSTYLNRIDLRSKNNSDFLSTKFAKILR
ncbi:hypothetical protein Pyn_10013 [Prunus yedoensis var. nudiflora]|uniref:Uncharacterized protein n=1 Tax=Prunus yedoensis var. nudiflora TaxID=2094558 RepID=A0A314XR76_PRUYE|nr:hypothetical protein Pyn_10013 [Prunus yedoensis var. nudiflora]